MIGASEAVDRRLAECWAISATIIAAIRDQHAALSAAVHTWEPAPCPIDWKPR